MKVLLSAYACDPTKGSEPGYGWNWAKGLALKGYEVHCLTQEKGRPGIEGQEQVKNLYFHYVTLPLKLNALYSFSQPTMYLHYIIWQWLAYKKGEKLLKKHTFDIAHHVTWGSLQLGSFLFKLKVPFVFGPAGGGQVAPKAFKKYFLNHWKSEEKREKVAKLMIRYNPAFTKMVQKAKVVIVSNPDTLEIAKANGAKKAFFSLDTALTESFFPENFLPKKPESGNLKLLWVGRFLPRKGILLLLDVMKELKSYPKITLTVVGDGEMRKDFLDKIKEYGLQETVYWKGAVLFEQVRLFYTTHDIFIFTSLRDSGGVQMVEAMAFGLPVITINLHGQAIIVNDDTGIRCSCDMPDKTIEELKDAVIYLNNSPVRVAEMSVAAYEFAKKQTWTAKIDAITKDFYPSI